MNTELLQQRDIAHAAELLKAGELVAFPTETVYGLGAVASNDNAVRKVFEAKGRPQDNPLIVHVTSTLQVSEVAQEILETTQTLMRVFWPGPLTLVLKKKVGVLDRATAQKETVCVRMPSHPLALALIEAVGEPLVAPSANLSGKPSPTTAQHVLADLADRIAAVLDGGASSIGIESTVLDLTQEMPLILRPGTITAAQISDALGGIEVLIHAAQKDASAQQLASPGMKYRHYAPNAEVVLIDDVDELVELVSENLKKNQSLMVLANQSFDSYQNNEQVVIYPLNAETLYAKFRQADQEGIQCVVVLVDEGVRKQLGLYNRLQKAAEAS